MAHNPYHIDTTYDTTAQSNQPSDNYVTDTLGYDFNQPIMGEDGTNYAEFFDPYDPQKERFAEQGNALQTAFFNEQQGFLESGTQNQLKDLTNNTPYTGFNNSGAIERSTQRSRDDIMRGYNTGLDSLNFQRANNQLGFEQDIYGYREDYKDKQRQTLLDLIQSDADIDKYATDYVNQDGYSNYRSRGTTYGDSAGGKRQSTPIVRTNG